MTDLKYQILEIVYHSHRREADRTKVENKFLPDPNPAHRAIDDLINQDKYLYIVVGTNRIKLTDSGVSAYEETRQSRKENSDKKRQQRFENKVSIASILVPLVTFFIGIIVEAKINIVEWFLSLF